MNQTEIPRDLPTFAAFVRGAMRREPTDIIVGECRDSETMDAAIQAAISGHVLTTTVHANNVPLTMQRIASLCPPAERENLVSAVAQSLRLVINQRLARSTDGRRTALREFLVFDAGLRGQFLGTDPSEWPALTRRAVEEQGQSYRAAIERALRSWPDLLNRQPPTRCGRWGERCGVTPASLCAADAGCARLPADPLGDGLLELADPLCRHRRRHVLLDDLALRVDLAGDVAADPALAGRVRANRSAGLEPAAVRMSAVDVEAVGRTLRVLLEQAERPILYRDPATGTRPRSIRRPSSRRLGSCHLSWSRPRRSGARRPAKVSRWT